MIDEKELYDFLPKDDNPPWEEVEAEAGAVPLERDDGIIVIDLDLDLDLDDALEGLLSREQILKQMAKSDSKLDVVKEQFIDTLPGDKPDKFLSDTDSEVYRTHGVKMEISKEASDEIDTLASDLLLEHQELTQESVYKEEEIGEDLSAALDRFIEDTAEPCSVDDMNTVAYKEICVEPFLFLDKVTATEIGIYKRNGIFMEDEEITEDPELMDLGVRIDKEFIKLGKVRCGLKLVTLIKLICPTRNIFLKLDDTNEILLGQAELSAYMLETL